MNILPVYYTNEYNELFRIKGLLVKNIIVNNAIGESSLVNIVLVRKTENDDIDTYIVKNSDLIEGREIGDVLSPTDKVSIGEIEHELVRAVSLMNMTCKVIDTE